MKDRGAYGTLCKWKTCQAFKGGWGTQQKMVKASLQHGPQTPIRPSPIQSRLESEGWEGKKAGKGHQHALHHISLFFFFSSPPTKESPHLQVIVCVREGRGLQGRVQRTVVIKSLEHRARVTHEGNEEPRLQCWPKGGKGGLGNKLRLRRQRWYRNRVRARIQEGKE